MAKDVGRSAVDCIVAPRDTRNMAKWLWATLVARRSWPGPNAPATWTYEELKWCCQPLGVGFVRGRASKSEAKIVKGALFDIRQDVVDPTTRLCSAAAAPGYANPAMPPSARGARRMFFVVHQDRKANLLQIVLATGTTC